MGFVDHLKGVNTETLFLEVAFGLHVIAGDLAKSIVTGSSPTHIVTIQQMLGETFGFGWKGPKGVWFRSINRAANKYHFHDGRFASDPLSQTYTADHTTNVITCTAHGLADGDMVIFEPGDTPEPLIAGLIYWVRDSTTNTLKVALTSGGSAIDLTDNGSGTLKLRENYAIQGIDPVFFNDIPHSNTAWIRMECPNGSEVGIPDFNTKDNPPTGFSGIFECQKGDIYDAEGSVSLADQYITNPADVIAFGCKAIRKYPNSRIGFQSIVDLQAVCDATITDDQRTLPQGVGLTARYYEGTTFSTLKSKRVDPVVQYDLSTGAPALDLTPTSFSGRFEGWIRFKYSETYTLYLTHNDTGKCWVNNLTTPIIDGTSFGITSGTFAATADAYEAIKLEWTNASGDSQFTLEWQSASQPRQTVPQDRLYPKNEARKRFEAHVAFTQRTTFDEFLRAILFTCNGGYQDIDGKLSFFCIDELTPSFDFTEENIVKNTLKYYSRFSQAEVLNLPNRFIAAGRDIDSRYLQPFEPPLEYDLTDQQSEAGRIIEETVIVGNTTRFQGLDNLAHYAKLKVAPMIAEFEGMPQTFPVLPGDLVTVTDSISGWVAKQFLCIEATDKAIDNDADNRIFKLLDWE
jgi:hypothetical protein